MGRRWVFRRPSWPAKRRRTLPPIIGEPNTVQVPLGGLRLADLTHTWTNTENRFSQIPLGTLRLARPTHTWTDTENRFSEIPLGALRLSAPTHQWNALEGENVLVPLGTLRFARPTHTWVTTESHIVEVPLGALRLSALTHTWDDGAAAGAKAQAPTTRSIDMKTLADRFNIGQKKVPGYRFSNLREFFQGDE